MPKISSIRGRLVYNSRGSKTIEIDVTSDNKYLGRACAPSGASVGKYEAQSFADNKPEKSLQVLNANAKKFIGIESDDLKSIQVILRKIDNTSNYSKCCWLEIFCNKKCDKYWICWDVARNSGRYTILERCDPGSPLNVTLPTTDQL